jgi:hypothetical protein
MLYDYHMEIPYHNYSVIGPLFKELMPFLTWNILVMVFELNLIAVELVQGKALVDLLWSCHAALGIALYI